MFWFDKTNANTIYGDLRKENHILCDDRQLSIAPDIVLDFKNLPFKNNSFHLIVFDPPHLKNVGENSWMIKKYGRINNLIDLKNGFNECWRVLKVNGTLIFKWNETQIKISQIKKLIRMTPLFGHTTTHNLKTHWMVFYKTDS